MTPQQRPPAPRSGPLARVGRGVTALAALLTLLALLFGLPAVLAVGSWAVSRDDQHQQGSLGHLLTTPDNGSLFLWALVVVGWLAWLAFAVSVLVEVPAQLRGRLPRRLPALGWSQRMAGGLVGAVLATLPLAGGAMAATLPSATLPPATAGASAGGTSATVQQASAHGDATGRAPATTAAPSSADRSGQPVYVVRDTRPAESLWSIAQRQLGSGEKWTEIARLNQGRVMDAEGRVFDADRPIQPGWRLLMPGGSGNTGTGTGGTGTGGSASGSTAGAPETVTVAPGDSLSSLAQRELGHAADWRELYDANRGVRGPDGSRLTDPDVIRPGMVLRVPGADDGGSDGTADEGSSTPGEGQAQGHGQDDGTTAQHTPGTAVVPRGQASPAPATTPRHAAPSPSSRARQQSPAPAASAAGHGRSDDGGASGPSNGQHLSAASEETLAALGSAMLIAVLAGAVVRRRAQRQALPPRTSLRRRALPGGRSTAGPMSGGPVPAGAGGGPVGGFEPALFWSGDGGDGSTRSDGGAGGRAAVDTPVSWASPEGSAEDAEHGLPSAALFGGGPLVALPFDGSEPGEQPDDEHQEAHPEGEFSAEALPGNALREAPAAEAEAGADAHAEPEPDAYAEPEPDVDADADDADPLGVAAALASADTFALDIETLRAPEAAPDAAPPPLPAAPPAPEPSFPQALPPASPSADLVPVVPPQPPVTPPSALPIPAQFPSPLPAPAHPHARAADQPVAADGPGAHVVRALTVEQGLELLNRALRSLARTVIREKRRLPPLTVARITPTGTVELYLAAPAQPIAPFRAAHAATVWWCTADAPGLLDSHAAEEVPAPYPALTSLGSTPDGGTVLVDLEAIRLLHVSGTPAEVARVLRTLALELTLTPLADLVGVHVVGVAQELAVLAEDRLFVHADLESAVAALRERDRDVRAALLAAGVPTPRDARGRGESGPLWAPDVVLCAEYPTGDLPAALGRLLDARPRGSVAVVTAAPPSGAGPVARWTLPATGRAQVPGLDLTMGLQALDDATYAAWLRALATDAPLPADPRDPPRTEPLGGGGPRPASGEVPPSAPGWAGSPWPTEPAQGPGTPVPASTPGEWWPFAEPDAPPPPLPGYGELPPAAQWSTPFQLDAAPSPNEAPAAGPLPPAERGGTDRPEQPGGAVQADGTEALRYSAPSEPTTPTVPLLPPDRHTPGPPAAEDAPPPPPTQPPFPQPPITTEPPFPLPTVPQSSGSQPSVPQPEHAAPLSGRDDAVSAGGAASRMGAGRSAARQLASGDAASDQPSAADPRAGFAAPTPTVPDVPTPPVAPPNPAPAAAPLPPRPPAASPPPPFPPQSAPAAGAFPPPGDSWLLTLLTSPPPLPVAAAPHVRVLGQVDVVGAPEALDGGPAARRRFAAMVEDAARAAVQPGYRRAPETDAWLSAGTPSAPATSADAATTVPATADAATTVPATPGTQPGSDWDDFQQLYRRGLTERGGAGETALARALALVRGVPLAEAPWLWAGPHRAVMAQQIVEAAHELAVRRLRLGDHRGAEAAARRGLTAAPAAQLLYRDLLCVYADAGAHPQLARAVDRLGRAVAEAGHRLEPESVALLAELRDEGPEPERFTTGAVGSP